jgi:hypothetical protein
MGHATVRRIEYPMRKPGLERILSTHTLAVICESESEASFRLCCTCNLYLYLYQHQHDGLLRTLDA